MIKSNTSLQQNFILRGKRMDIVNRLKDKNIKVREIPGWGSYLRNRWEEVFVGHLNQQEKEEIHLSYSDGACGYLWHVFSYEERDCLEKGQANQAFNNVSKGKCYVFYQHSDYAFIMENTELALASDFLEKDDCDEEDIYIVDRDFTWTYVNTHEESCGPYYGEIVGID